MLYPSTPDEMNRSIQWRNPNIAQEDRAWQPTRSPVLVLAADSKSCRGLCDGDGVADAGRAIKMTMTTAPSMPTSRHGRAACSCPGRRRSWGCWGRTPWTIRPRTSRWRCRVHLCEAAAHPPWLAGNRRGRDTPEEIPDRLDQMEAFTNPNMITKLNCTSIFVSFFWSKLI